MPNCTPRSDSCSRPGEETRCRGAFPIWPSVAGLFGISVGFLLLHAVHSVRGVYAWLLPNEDLPTASSVMVAKPVPVVVIGLSMALALLGPVMPRRAQRLTVPAFLLLLCALVVITLWASWLPLLLGMRNIR